MSLTSLAKMDSEDKIKLYKDFPKVFHAAACNDVEYMKALLNDGHDVNILCHIPTIGVLHTAAENNSLAIIDFLVTEQKFDINALANFGKTPLWYAVSEKDCLEAVRLLLKLGAEVNIEATSILRKAMEQDNIEAAKLLIEKGASTTQTDMEDGHSPATLIALYPDEYNELRTFIEAKYPHLLLDQEALNNIIQTNPLLQDTLGFYDEALDHESDDSDEFLGDNNIDDGCYTLS